MTEEKKNTTKQRILGIAIDLFAQYGFKEVSMRQIASEVGIKASSLYKHYTSKEDILEKIYGVFSGKLRQTEAPIPDFSSPLDYFTKAYEMFRNIMTQPEVMRIAKIITRDQLYSDDVRKLMVEEMIIKPVQGTKLILDMMQKTGMINIRDTQVVAEEYCSYIIYLFFEQNILNREPDLDLIDSKMEQHNEYIVRCIMNEGK